MFPLKLKVYLDLIQNTPRSPLTPKRKLDFGDVTDEEENEGIEEDIEEARRAEEALVLERNRIENRKVKTIKRPTRCQQSKSNSPKTTKKKIGGIYSPNESGNESGSEYRL